MLFPLLPYQQLHWQELSAKCLACGSLCQDKTTYLALCASASWEV